MDKSPEAFRTISEVAESLETPAHVLRFWESRFPQIRPVKRAGGRRYYRPADVALLSGIRHLLHDEGMTIRGVQKILREQGVRHVAAMAAGGEDALFDADILEGEILADEGPDGDTLDGMTGEAEPATALVFELAPVPRQAVAAEDALGEVVLLHSPARPPAEPEPEPEPEHVAEAGTADAPPQSARPEVATPDEEVPEAGHIWVDDEPELELSAPTPLFPTPLFPTRLLPEPIVAAEALAAVPDQPAVADRAAPAPEALFTERVPETTAKLTGVAARLRALPRRIRTEGLPELMELHSRLGLLHAQMAEALRLRR